MPLGICGYERIMGNGKRMSPFQERSFDEFSPKHRRPSMVTDGMELPEDPSGVPSEPEAKLSDAEREALEREAEVIPHPAFLTLRDRIIEQAKERSMQANADRAAYQAVLSAWEKAGGNGNPPQEPRSFNGFSLGELAAIMNAEEAFLRLEGEIIESRQENPVWVNNDCFESSEESGVTGEYCGHSEHLDGKIVHNSSQPSGDHLLVDRSRAGQVRVRIADAAGHGMQAAPLMRLFDVFEAAAERRGMKHPIKAFDAFIESLAAHFNEQTGGLVGELVENPEVSLLDLSIRSDGGQPDQKHLSVKSAGNGHIFWIEPGDDGVPVLRRFVERASDVHGEHTKNIDLDGARGFPPGSGFYNSSSAAEFTLPSETTVFAMSDGIMDATDISTGKSLEEVIDEEFDRIVAKNSGQPLDVVEEAFTELLKKYHPLEDDDHIRQNDDVTWVRVRQ